MNITDIEYAEACDLRDMLTEIVKNTDRFQLDVDDVLAEAFANLDNNYIEPYEVTQDNQCRNQVREDYYADKL